MNTSNAVQEYIEQIITQQNIEPYTPEGQELASFLYHELDRFTKESIINALPASKLDECAELLKSHPSSETLHEFAQTHIPNLEEVFLQAFIKFRDFYLRKEVTHARS